MTPESTRSVFLDAARAFAAFLVFSSHARGIFLASWREAVGFMADDAPYGLINAAAVNPVAHLAVRPSHQAVILFFVLSGYFVGGSVLKAISSHRWSWKTYFTKRLTRLWLVLLPALVLTQIFDGLGAHLAPAGALYSYTGPDSPMLIGHHDLATFFGNVFFLQGILTSSLGSNDPLWSLAYEFWYYAAFPLLLLALLGRRPAWQRLIYLVLLFAILFGVGATITEYFVIWLMGLVPHVLKKTARPIPLFAIALGAVLVLLTAVGLIKSGLDIFPADLLLGLVFTAWVYAAKNARAVDHGSMFARLSFHASEFSYTLYLVHVPMLIFLSAILVGPWRPWPITPANLAVFGAIYGFVVVYAVCVYWLFERHTAALQKWSTRKVKAMFPGAGSSPSRP